MGSRSTILMQGALVKVSHESAQNLEPVLVTKPSSKHPKRAIVADFGKCLLAMSDLQIISGFAILLSWFLQLSCGLPAFNWAVISNLAWFQSSHIWHIWQCYAIIFMPMLPIDYGDYLQWPS